jgi:CubicO group peptidase (beta-lactamase class C family)
VSGGAYWGGGLWVNAADLALLGELYLRRGRWGARQLVSGEWVDMTWTPCPVKPDYGLLWWLNDAGTVYSSAPTSGRCARGNLGRHLLWVDPARRLVVASHLGRGRRPPPCRGVGRRAADCHGDRPLNVSRMIGRSGERRAISTNPAAANTEA